MCVCDTWPNVHMYAPTGAQVQTKAESSGFFIFCACLDSRFCAPVAQGPVTQPRGEVKELQTPVFSPQSRRGRQHDERQRKITGKRREEPLSCLFPSSPAPSHLQTPDIPPIMREKMAHLLFNPCLHGDTTSQPLHRLHLQLFPQVGVLHASP